MWQRGRVSYLTGAFQLILAYSWARPAVLVASKGRGEMFYFFCFFTFIFVPFSSLFLSSHTKILDGFQLDSKLTPSGCITDFRKFWRNTPRHIFFPRVQAYSKALMQAYFFIVRQEKKSTLIITTKTLRNNVTFFPSPPGIKTRPVLLILKVSSLIH